MLYFTYNGQIVFSLLDNTPLSNIKEKIDGYLNDTDYYLTSNGKIIKDTAHLKECFIHVQQRLLGGKGGFGSMLRAIGAQIEKTTNREACRDLSGRRLRDINEEKRLKTWIAQQAEREKEQEDRRQKKLQRYCHQPKHEFKDAAYDEVRSALPEKVQEAFEEGLKASVSGECSKRKHEDDKKQKTKKSRLWLDEEELSSSEDTDTENEESESTGGGNIVRESDNINTSNETKLVDENVEGIESGNENNCDKKEISPGIEKEEQNESEEQEQEKETEKLLVQEKTVN